METPPTADADAPTRAAARMLGALSTSAGLLTVAMRCCRVAMS